MSCARENMDLWFHLTSPWGRFRHSYVPKRGRLRYVSEIFRSPYFWHDTFGKRWRRWVGCRLTGHTVSHSVEDHRGDRRPYCFRCEQFTDGRGDKN